MSKAFTSEESPDTAIAGRPAVRAEGGALRPITSAGHARLSEELRVLVEVERARARLAQDPEAPARLAQIEHRILFLLTTLESVRVVEAVVDGRVRFGCEVQLEWEDGRQQTLRIVGPDEADLARGEISVDAPLARALLGRAPGDEVEVRLPRGLERAELSAIRA